MPCEVGGEDFLPYVGAKDDGVVKVIPALLPVQNIYQLRDGILAGGFDVNPIILNPEGLVYRGSDYSTKKRPAVFNVIWNGICENLAGPPVLFKSNDTCNTYNLILKNPIRIKTFVSIRNSKTRRQQTVLLHLPGVLDKFVSETDRICIVVDKDGMTVKTMYPVLKLLYFSPHELDQEIKKYMEGSAEKNE